MLIAYGFVATVPGASQDKIDSLGGGPFLGVSELLWRP